MYCRYGFIANFVYRNVRYGRSFSQELALLSAGECFKRKQPPTRVFVMQFAPPDYSYQKATCRKARYVEFSFVSCWVNLSNCNLQTIKNGNLPIKHEKSKQHGYEPRTFSYHLYTYKNVAFFAFHDRALKLTISLFNDLQIRVKTALNCQKLVVSVRNVV